MKVLIAVGGGGHFSPALAVINAMPKEWEILLVGRKYAFENDSTLSLEYQTAQRLKIPFEVLTTGRLQRTFTKKTLTSLLKVPVGLAQATMILKKFKPDVVVSFGGYVTVPVALAAKALKIPIIVHEQTLHAGLANKIVAKVADVVCTSWEESAQYFPKGKIILTGNPLRKEFLQSVAHDDSVHKSGKKDVPLIYITGGSGGAHGINVLIEGSLEKLLNKYRIIHQTGDAQEFGDYYRLEAAKDQLPEALQKRYLIKKFIPPDHVGEIFSQADMVIARSGINTVTELLYLGKPCLLIPLPHGQRNEQKSNAQMVEKIGIGKMLEQDEVFPERFSEVVDMMFEHYESLLKHKDAARAVIKTDATEKILSVIKSFNSY